MDTVRNLKPWVRTLCAWIIINTLVMIFVPHPAFQAGVIVGSAAIVLAITWEVSG